MLCSRWPNMRKTNARYFRYSKEFASNVPTVSY